MTDYPKTSILMLPSSLLDLLSNDLVLESTLPYLSLSALVNLARTNRSFRDLVFTTPKIFSFLDLSKCRGAYVPPLAPIDSGGHSWRAQRMDENLTEDEFYAGPLRGIFSRLARKKILRDVHTLILDGLASVTVDLLSEIIQSTTFNVRILSVIQCPNLNHRKLIQLLSHVCRPNRPEGTPRLQGLYIFGKIEPDTVKQPSLISNFGGIISSQGAQLGASSESDESLCLPGTDSWYAPSGRVISEGYSQRSPWEEAVKICHGIISFDAVLCTNMHTAMAPYLHEASSDYLTQYKPGIAPLATVALGPEGCAACGKAPVGSPIWGETDAREFPLLRPPPFSGKLIDAVRPPLRMVSHTAGMMPRRLVTSCSWCLVNRHCQQCHRWWCGDCFDPKKATKLRELDRLSAAGLSYLPARHELSYDGQSSSSSIKVYNSLCVENCLVAEMMAGAGSGGMWG